VDIYTLAENFETDVKTLRKFLRLPQWRVIDVERLHSSSIPQIKNFFDVWVNFSVSTRDTSTTSTVDEDIEIKSSSTIHRVLSVNTLGTKTHVRQAKKITLERERFLQQRLSECGLSVAQQRHNTKWRKLDKYDTSRSGNNDNDEL
jgi:hypothetical protein